MSGFTPGPWFVRRGRVYAGRPDKIGPLVASLGIRRDPVEEDANGRLIEAAPDLLAAVEELVDRFDTVDGEPFFDAPDSPWTVARAAIAKATGEAQ